MPCLAMSQRVVRDARGLCYAGEGSGMLGRQGRRLPCLHHFLMPFSCLPEFLLLHAVTAAMPVLRHMHACAPLKMQKAVQVHAQGRECC